MTREIKYFEALREAQAQCLESDRDVVVMGLGVPGPTGVFGTTKNLADDYGTDRVFDMPSSENAMTGMLLGASSNGMRPIMVHMRVDFAVLSMEPLVNQAAKWHYMYGGKMRAPLTVRMIIGQGWGQGPQHSQALQAWFAHIPGLKVIMPTTAHDAKGMLIAAVRDDAPVISIEHRWLYGVSGAVPEEMYETPIGKARIMRPGKDVTIVAASYASLLALRAAEMLADAGIDAEVLDLRTITPLDRESIVQSVRKTGRLVVADTGTAEFGISAEIVCTAVEGASESLKSAPRRVGLPSVPTPTSPALSEHFYPRAINIAEAAAATLGVKVQFTEPETGKWHDVPDPSFTGPY